MGGELPVVVPRPGNDLSKVPRFQASVDGRRRDTQPTAARYGADVVVAQTQVLGTKAEFPPGFEAAIRTQSSVPGVRPPQSCVVVFAGTL
jgi:hypothetical protein